MTSSVHTYKLMHSCTPLVHSYIMSIVYHFHVHFFIIAGIISDDSGITTGQVVAATVTPVVFVTLLAGLIVLMLFIYLVKMKRERFVNCNVQFHKELK